MTVLQEFRLPDLGEGLTESDLVAWRVAPGDRVALNQVIAEVETAKALVELPSPVDGVVAQLHAEPGQTVAVGEPLLTFDVEADERPPNLVGYGAGPDRSGPPRRRARRGAPDAPDAPDDSDAPVAAAPPRREGRPRSTPPVRRLAAALGVDLTTVEGTGEGGLVTRADVEAAARGTAPAAAPAPVAAASAAPPRVASQDAHDDLHIPIAGVRKQTAAAMVASAFTAPHVTMWITVDVTPLTELRARLASDPLTGGTRLTLLALLARAVCVALRRHPTLNSRWDEASQEIVQFSHVDLGIAVATERGLIVPAIEGADALPPLELAAALDALTLEAREGRTPLARMQAGTFTISNVGVFGVEGGTPILNRGQAAILAVGAVQRRPWEHEGGIALREVMTLSLSIDHRVVDGEQGGRFLAELGRLLADPALALVLA